jgi:hypothetical protein
LGRYYDERADLDRNSTSDGGLAGPGERLVHVSDFQHPETTDVFLGFKVRPVGDEDLAIGLVRSDLALLGALSPPTKVLTPAATISAFSARISRIMASPSAAGL